MVLLVRILGLDEIHSQTNNSFDCSSKVMLIKRIYSFGPCPLWLKQYFHLPFPSYIKISPSL